MIGKQEETAETEVSIYVEDYVKQSDSQRAVNELVGETITLKREFKNTVQFTYSNDVLMVGDPFVIMVPNVRGQYTGKFNVGARVKLYLKNPNVAGGALTLKHTGIIVERSASSVKGAGSIIQLQCADIGWHLQENDAPLWYNLRSGDLVKLLNDPKFILPSWRFSGVQRESVTAKNTRLNNGLRDVKILLNAQAIQPLQYIQVEPGDKIIDLIFQYARRLNLLVNVGPNGHIILWNPDYNQKPLYRLDYHQADDIDAIRNNVESAKVRESAQSIYTKVVVVGERVQFEFDDPNNPNAAKFRGAFSPKTAPLPFDHNLFTADPEMFTLGLAAKGAEWKWKRGIFDSWSATYTVRGHYQGGMWWESDTMCEVHDSVHGHDGLFYVSSVTYIRDGQGDRTEVTIRKPNLLTAAFGVYPNAPTIKYSTKSESGTADTPTKSTQTSPS